MSDNSQNYIEGAGGGSETLTNENNAIEGAGIIGGNGLTFVNDATIVATSADTQLVIESPSITFFNTGLIEAQGAAGLLINSTHVNNVGGLIDSIGSAAAVYLEDATITGGTLAGVTEAVSTFSVLDGTQGNAIDATGTIVVNGDSAIQLQGMIDNSGVISLQSASISSPAYLLVNQAGATLAGGGVVALSDSNGNLIETNGGNTLTNLDNTIEGAGQIDDGNMAVVNDGTIAATYADNGLTIDAKSLVSNGVLAADGGTLLVEDGIGGSGVIEITDGGVVDVTTSFFQSVDFTQQGASAAGLLIVNASTYTATIYGAAVGDSIDLEQLIFDYVPPTFDSSTYFIAGYDENAAGNGGSLVLADLLTYHTIGPGGVKIEHEEIVPLGSLSFSGNYAEEDFALGEGPGGGTEVTVKSPAPPTAIQAFDPSLTTLTTFYSDENNNSSATQLLADAAAAVNATTASAILAVGNSGWQGAYNASIQAGAAVATDVANGNTNAVALADALSLYGSILGGVAGQVAGNFSQAHADQLASAAANLGAAVNGGDAASQIDAAIAGVADAIQSITGKEVAAADLQLADTAAASLASDLANAAGADQAVLDALLGSAGEGATAEQDLQALLNDINAIDSGQTSSTLAADANQVENAIQQSTSDDGASSNFQTVEANFVQDVSQLNTDQADGAIQSTVQADTQQTNSDLQLLTQLAGRGDIQTDLNQTEANL